MFTFKQFYDHSYSIGNDLALVMVTVENKNKNRRDYIYIRDREVPYLISNYNRFSIYDIV